ncbi:uncharacterized protein G2W53_032454 [Senna tora]|uniref:Uncharacterized protein n=1 Tax=Senna tora TaxID=362788 RepID=A0A834SW05_9FABA|nr:uncharacterized protein G2W53_032454 [Senna tora]
MAENQRSRLHNPLKLLQQILF